MASFTTDLNRYSFNPYVQQVPVDDYVRVGLQKQQQYDQGVQKTQSYIDSIAGMDVIKPEQKDYLNQRLGQLTNNISKVVGQDFSQSQLTNQIGGLTNQIAKDPIIQSAVSSTARYRSESAKMATAQQKGESDVANEYVFGKQFNDWYSDKDPRSQFQGSYTPYIDVHKKLIGAINAMHPDEQIQDFPFQMKDGQVVKGPDGAPIPDYAMIAKQTKSLDANKIQAAISAAMSPSDYNQLAINGQYEYRGLDKAGMKTVTDNSYNYKLGQINDTLQGLAVQKLSNITDPVYQGNLDSQIRDINNHKESLINQYSKDVDFLDKGNLDQYKGEVYKSGWLSNMTTGYSYAQNSLTFKDNPYMKTTLQLQDNARDAAKLKLEYEKFGYQKDEDLFNRGIKLQELDIKRMEAEGRLAKELGTGKLGKDALGPGIVGNINTETLPPSDLTAFSAVTQNMRDAIDGSRLQLLASLDATKDFMVMDMGVDGKTPSLKFVDDKSKTQALTSLAHLQDQWAAGKTVPAAAREFFTNSANTQIRLANRDASLKDMYNSANRESGFNPDTFFNGVSGLNLETPAYGKQNISAREIADFRRKLIKVVIPGQSFSGGPMGGSPGFNTLSDAEATKQFSTPAEKILYNAFKKQYYGQALSQGEKTINSKLADISEMIKGQNIKLDVRDSYLNNVLGNQTMVKQPTSFPIGEKGEYTAQTIAGNLVANFQEQGAGKLPGGSDIGTIGKMYKDKGTHYSIEAAQSGDYYLKLTNPTLGGAQRIPMTADQLEKQFPGSTVNQQSAIREALNLTKTMVKPTTDVQRNGVMSAFVLNNDNLNTYGVKYHVEEPFRNHMYQIKVYITRNKDAQGNSLPKTEWQEYDVPLPDLVDEEGLSTFLSKFGDQKINQMLNDQNKK